MLAGIRQVEEQLVRACRCQCLGAGIGDVEDLVVGLFRPL
jgi:hypothetical protein